MVRYAIERRVVAEGGRHGGSNRGRLVCHAGCCVNSGSRKPPLADAAAPEHVGSGDCVGFGIAHYGPNVVDDAPVPSKSYR